MHDDDAPICRNAKDVAGLSGRRVRLVGDYVEVDLRKDPVPPPEYRGRAGVRLEDGRVVMLEPGWAEAGLRSEDERKRLAGKRVEAIGSVWVKPPKPPRPIAYPLAPCLAPVESVREAG